MFVACLFAALFALVALVAHATVPVAAPPMLQVAELPAGADPPPESVVAGAADARFQAVAGTQASTSTTSARWFRIALGRDDVQSEPLVLAIRDTLFARATVYAPPAYVGRMLGHSQSDPQPRFSRRALTEVLPPGLHADQPIYLRFEPTLRPWQPRFELHGLAAYQSADMRHVQLSTMFASVQFTMVLVGLCLWLALRDRVFAYFVTYAGLQLGYLLLVGGEMYDLPGGALFSASGQKASWLFATLSAVFSIAFILEFCDLRRILPRAAALLSAMRWPFVAAALVTLLPLPAVDRLVPTLVNLMLLVSTTTSLAIVGLAAWRGNRASRFFLVAWMPQVAFTAFRVVQLLLVLPQPAWLEYGLPFTMAFSSLVVTLGLADATLHARRERDIAHQAAERDGLTGALNRRALTKRLAEAVASAQARSRPLALLFLDLDHFKSINDRHGHLAGDLCLRAVADAADGWLAPGRIFGRYGGEEFLVILPDCTREQAFTAAEQLRRRIERLDIDTEDGGERLHLTASIGLAMLLGAHDTVEQLIERADSALYRAKAEGRNRVGAALNPPAAPVPEEHARS
jgi:diguanylate cyclase (GGDEF)-like protein